MKPRRMLAPRDASEVFDRAVEERALAVLTIQNGQDWCIFKSRFLERDPNGRFFVLDYQPAHGESLPPVDAGQYVGVSLRQNSRKILFATLAEAKGHFVLEDKTAVPAIRYRWPESMTELQRRSYFRTPVPEGISLLISMWPGGADARPQAQAATLQIVTGELIDLSCGGTLVRLHQPSPPEWVEGDTVGVELQLPDMRPPIVVNGRFRGARTDGDGSISVGLQFIGLELVADGRVVLQRLSGAIQKLHRLGIASGRCAWNANPMA